MAALLARMFVRSAVKPRPWFAGVRSQTRRFWFVGADLVMLRVTVDGLDTGAERDCVLWR